MAFREDLEAVKKWPGWEAFQPHWNLLSNIWAWPFYLLIGIFAARAFDEINDQTPVTMSAFAHGLVDTLLRLPADPLFQLGFIVFAILAFRNAVRSIRKHKEATEAGHTAIRQAAIDDFKAALTQSSRLSSLMAACFLSNRYSMQEAHDSNFARAVAEGYLEDINNLRIGKTDFRSRHSSGTGGREAHASILDGSVTILQRLLTELYTGLGKEWAFGPYKGVIEYDDHPPSPLPSKGERPYDPEKNRDFFEQHTNNYRAYWDGLSVISGFIDARWQRTRELLTQVEEEAERYGK